MSTGYFRILAAVMAVVFAASTADALEPTWHIDFDAVFDNREGDATFSPSKTYFFTSLAPEAGLRFSPSDRIAGGAVWVQPIGCEWEGHRISPTLYYRHAGSQSGSPWSFSIGMFPRRQMTEELPGFLWNDSLTYTQRNIRGVLLQYRRERGFAEAYVDWRGMQTRKQREAFNIVFYGRWHPRAGNPFFVGGHAMMNHLARQENGPVDQYVVDNFVVNPYIGVDLSGRTALDSLFVRTGPLLSVERDRSRGNAWEAPVGVWLEATAEWKWLGLKNSLYFGQRQFRSYDSFSTLLYQGEPYYQAKFYDRAQVYAHVYRNQYVDLLASLDFNFARSTFNFYQRLMVRVTLP